MESRTTTSSLAAFKRIEGQVRGLARMVEDDRYCIDILTQLRAVKAALGKVEQDILRQHLQHCVAHAFHAGSEKDRLEKVEELIDVLKHQTR